MTKAEIVDQIENKTGVDKMAIKASVDAFMDCIKESMIKGENIYLRGFGTFVLVPRAMKVGRIISKNLPIEIPAHVIPKFKPSKEFTAQVKKKRTV